MNDSTTSPDASSTLKTIIIDDGTLLLRIYYLYRTKAIKPLKWTAVKLRVPENMSPELILFNGMYQHGLGICKPPGHAESFLQLTSAMQPEASMQVKIHQHDHRWYNYSSSQKLYGLLLNNDLWLLQEGESARHEAIGLLPEQQLENISRLIPEWDQYDIYSLEHGRDARGYDLLREGTVPHAAAMDFLESWWANPDQHLAPRLIPCREDPEPEPEPSEGIPCVFIDNTGDTTVDRPRRHVPSRPYYAMVFLYNKLTGYIDGGVWFQDEHINLINPRTDRSYARFEYLDPESTRQAIQFIRTQLPRSGDCPPGGRTREQLRDLARDMVAQRVFFSTQLHDPDLLCNVFMTILFMGREALGYYTDHQLEIFYEYMEKAGSRSINGYPMFMSHHAISVQDYDATLKIYRKMQAALEQIEEVEEV